ncbi:beta-ketoacyl-ACP synthase [Reyranella sp. CPCC 100927]|uniref:beta-ketoacyl-ACP synthase n=1 Tax=Reyranella sp. CPCC 100927 TaxID=2599616 RepID=UPI0011B452A5|nr:beta-ketoacyl-ACP synthase [Reyranella sp. CPCC 100927]TWT13687.1 beta-ketoacyl-ACP synthase [Reyranella sp. CPCC 100927]
MRRVVVTGMGGVTALGDDWPVIREALAAGRTAVRVMPEWDRFEGVNTRLAAPVPNFSGGERYPRKKTRTMGPVSLMAVQATERALATAGLLDDPVVRSGTTGIAYGSSFGSPAPVLGFAELMQHGKSKTLNATSYIQMMSHTAAVNIGLFFGVTGRVITTSSACTSGSQAIGYAYEAIGWGKADVMIAGGAEELDITEAAVFDTLFATSTRNDAPSTTPKPYDRDRDGLVIGEGATTLILEDYDRALGRGAPIFAEVVGYGTNTDGSHVTQPRAETMEVAMRLALRDADLSPEAIGMVNGHGTATDAGDIAETTATAAVFGLAAPIHSLKSYFGHTLGACGALEAWLGIEMLREGWFVPTANLKNIDPRCGDLDYLAGNPRRIACERFMSNNFAFGGINTSLIFARL